MIIIIAYKLWFGRRTSKILVPITPKSKCKVEAMASDYKVRAAPVSKLLEKVTKEGVCNLKLEDIVKGDLIGIGAYGIVHKGTWQGTTVAIKTPHRNIIAREKHYQQFVQEIKVLSSLHHPNVIMFLGASVTRPNIFLVIEFMKNGCVYAFIRNPENESIFNISCLIRFALGIARGMRYLHHLGVLQRDLRSDNVLLDANLNCKLSDFGLSYHLYKAQKSEKLELFQQNHGPHRKPSLGSKEESMGGNLYWMAPEILRGERFTEQADVYSFGILIWELFCREDPYQSESPTLDIMAKIVFQDFRPKIPSYCPADYTSLIQNCWKNDPQVRPTFKEIFREIHNISRDNKQILELCNTDRSLRTNLP